MSTEYAIDSHANLIQKFLDARYVWQFTSFILAADIAWASFNDTPLWLVRLENIDATLPIGAILWFLVGYAFLTLVAWTIRKIFFHLTYDAFRLVSRTFTHSKELHEYKRELLERARHTVSEWSLHDFACKTNNGVAFDIYRTHVSERRAAGWMHIFQFLVGILLSIAPLSPRCSISTLLSSFDINTYWVLIPSVVLALWATHGGDHDPFDVYVGEVMAPIINPPKREM